MRAKRWAGPLPDAVTRALDLLRSLGHGEEARAALDALKPQRKIGRPVTFTPEEATRTADAFRLRWREDPELTVHQTCKMISKLHGGTLTPQAIRSRLERYCAARGTTAAAWEGEEKRTLTRP